MVSLPLYDYEFRDGVVPALNRRPERGGGHPTMAAALLMVAIVVGIMAVSLLGALGR